MRAQAFYLAQEHQRVAVERVLMERVLGIPMTYFIVKWAVGSFLHCALLLLIPDLNDHNWVNVFTHQLAGLSDGYGNLQHKAECTHSGPGSSLTQEQLGKLVGRVNHLLDNFGI